jgi:hypothetical protein
MDRRPVSVRNMSLSLFSLVCILMMTVIATIASVNLPVYAQSTGDDEESLNDSCRDTGFNDGQNGPFNSGTYDLCGDEANGDKEYYDGFMDGCMSVEGNTRDVCVSATDG